jgi:hypothetical protein
VIERLVDEMIEFRVAHEIIE